MQAILKYNLGYGENSEEYEFQCAIKAIEAQSAIHDVLNLIRSRLKYEEKVTKREREILEEIQAALSAVYVEG